ncbi:uncharacterized protein LOC120781747 [Bactrocera tryoni]|uniref:uncharacterized protein LOC120781747 n=1 Tax=Bactrocera tryoni TaxID=59916 RepID=UPI001A95F4F7|nr:uncharacterized protein LOC120781747 [Bactrocera tryoni]
MIIEFFCEDNEERKSKEDETMEDLMHVLALGEECRYRVQFIQNSIPKSRIFLNEILWELDENRFKKITRLDLIKGDKLFNKIRSGKQFPIKTQLAIVLYRLGSSGEGAMYSFEDCRFIWNQ